MLHYLKMEESEVPRMCLELYREYGTTMAGLKVKLKPFFLPILLFLLNFLVLVIHVTYEINKFQL